MFCLGTAIIYRRTSESEMAKSGMKNRFELAWANVHNTLDAMNAEGSLVATRTTVTERPSFAAMRHCSVWPPKRADRYFGVAVDARRSMASTLAGSSSPILPPRQRPLVTPRRRVAASAPPGTGVDTRCSGAFVRGLHVRMDRFRVADHPGAGQTPKTGYTYLDG